MRKTIYLIAIALCLIGCQNEKQIETTSQEALSDIETTLTEDETQSKGTDIIIVYYPDSDYNLIKKEMPIDETDLIKSLETVFKDSKNETLLPLMSQDATIKNIRVNEAEDTCYIDFDDAFTTHMNLGSGAEYAVITSIVDTLGGYFSVQYVEITVNGSTFETGHNLYEGKMEVSQP